MTNEQDINLIKSKYEKIHLGLKIYIIKTPTNPNVLTMFLFSKSQAIDTIEKRKFCLFYTRNFLVLRILFSMKSVS